MVAPYLVRVQVDAGEVGLLLLPLLGERLQLRGLQGLQTSCPLGQPVRPLRHRCHTCPRARPICAGDSFNVGKGVCLVHDITGGDVRLRIHTKLDASLKAAGCPLQPLKQTYCPMLCHVTPWTLIKTA